MKLVAVRGETARLYTNSESLAVSMVLETKKQIIQWAIKVLCTQSAVSG